MQTLNPEFKKQLFSLKNIAMNEFNIQISTDKMVQDEQYRDIVFDELGDLDNEELNRYVNILKKTPIFIESSAEEFSLEKLPSLSSQKKRNKAAKQNAIMHEEKSSKAPNRLALIVLLFFCISLLAAGAAWYGGYLQIDLTSQQALAQQTTSATEQPSKIDEINTGTAQPLTVTPATIAPMLPSRDRIVSLRLHGSNTIGENLAPALLEAYLESIGVQTMQWVQGEHTVERELQYIKDDQVYAVELHAHGSSTGFNDLLAGEADMAMSSRKIKEKELEQIRPLYGDLAHAGQENIIGLDGLAIIVNPNNSINTLTSRTLAKIFSGEISNWKTIGGSDLPIKIYARDKNSGTWDTFKNLVLKANNKNLIDSAIRLESSNELSEEVSKDPGAIGFIGLPYINHSKAISIAASAKTSPIYPTRFTVSTEDYPLSRRLYMYAPSLANQMVKGFTQFVVSHAGQEIVEQIGLISQNIKLETIHKIKSAPQIYNNYTEVAKRLSVNFRFKSGSNELDNKGQRDLLRLVDFMTDHQQHRIILMGFSDALGEAKRNLKLSILRAGVLENALTERGLNIVAVEGFGSLLPVASNNNPLGRSKNRRVEVWVY